MASSSAVIRACFPGRSKVPPKILEAAAALFKLGV